VFVRPPGRAPPPPPPPPPPPLLPGDAATPAHVTRKRTPPRATASPTAGAPPPTHASSTTHGFVHSPLPSPELTRVATGLCASSRPSPSSPEAAIPRRHVAECIGRGARARIRAPRCSLHRDVLCYMRAPSHIGSRVCRLPRKVWCCLATLFSRAVSANFFGVSFGHVCIQDSENNAPQVPIRIAHFSPAPGLFGFCFFR